MSRRRRWPAPAAAILALLGAEVAAVLVLGAVGVAQRRGTGQDRRDAGALAASLRLTDLALWTAASYCRHPSQADVFSAHGEHPAAPDHFPAGSIVPPPGAGGDRSGRPSGRSGR